MNKAQQKFYHYTVVILVLQVIGVVGNVIQGSFGLNFLSCVAYAIFWGFTSQKVKTQKASEISGLLKASRILIIIGIVASIILLVLVFPTIYLMLSIYPAGLVGEVFAVAVYVAAIYIYVKMLKAQSAYEYEG
jgi:hypothetical protein